MRRGNVPAELTTFVGRRAEAATVERALATYRAVTLTGTGGVGKTRLALRVADEVADDFPDGVWLVELDDVRDGPLLPSTVLGGLGLRDDGGIRVESLLVDHFRDRRALLVLDGCDTVVDACAALAEVLLRAAPELRILSSSRLPLHTLGESVVPVGPMELPPEPVGDEPGPDLAGVDAVTLFLDRARAIRPGLDPDPRGLATIARICRRLDGLPMAIELAADRLDVLSLAELDERLDDAYRLLARSKRGAPARQRTLQALVDSSYALCSPREQLLWTRLAVFSGRLGLPAAEFVCADDALPREGMLDLVAGLVDKSVLSRDDRPVGAGFRLPRLLREDAAHRLAASGEEPRLRDRHLDWCRRLAQQASEGLLGARSDSWMEQLRGSHTNVRAALEHSLSRPERVADGLRLAADLWFYWIMAGQVAEGREWLARGLRSAPEPSVARAQALGAAAYLAIVDDDAADDLLAEANRLEARLDDIGLTANLRFVEGFLEVRHGDMGTACDLLAAARDAFRAAGDAMGISKTLCLLGMASTLAGDTERGLRCCAEFLARPDASTDNYGLPYIQWTIALASWIDGDRAAAVRAQRRCAELMRRFDDRFGMTTCVQSAALYQPVGAGDRRAALLLGAARTHRIPALTVLDELLDRRAAEVRTALGDRYADLVEEGRRLSLDAAMDLVVGRTAAPAATGAVLLSKREWEVAELVAAGRSNKEIAAALVISTRTAEGHVQKILGKLEFLSRAQIATWMTEHRLRGAGPTDGHDDRVHSPSLGVRSTR
ncbi:LuxR family transcriptional regulator [Pseudonocardia xishanensis]|uniref:LuxR family transcriptional regulator n=1 Tax=Pseudonocardia xishanensis TaxID=630995 RepID=A0ABP8RPE1_9PSEU